MGRVKHIHFVGIGGVGMAPIAEILLREGYKISGSDLSDNSLTQRLAGLGATIYQGHVAQNITNADVVVYSSAVKPNNPEFKAAKSAGIPVLQRAQMLAELMRFRDGIAIAGTHGKTTTTSLVTSLLLHGNLDPTYVIGGKLNSSGAHASMGNGRYIVVEADESDASFLYLKPTMAIVTNIDADHMETYNHDFRKLKQSFIDFLHHLPFYGPAVICIDDPVIAEIDSDIQRWKIRYGMSAKADIQAIHFSQTGMSSRFTLVDKMRNERYDIELNMPGQHNVLNTLSAIAIARECGVSIKSITECLKTFSGVGRRLQPHGELIFSGNRKVTLYEDYGHHPKELSVTVEALKQAYPDRRLCVAFQPHRYSRTQSLYNEFVDVLSEIEHLILLPIYPASEEPIEGINSEALAASIAAQTQRAPICASLEELTPILQKHVKNNDVILFLGAGSIGAYAASLPTALAQSMAA